MTDEKSVLIADDEASLRLLMRASLSAEGYRIIEAVDGVEAETLARRERPDLVLLDVGMPGRDGYTVCRALKSDPETAGIVVVMLTARAQQGDREQGILVGADAYLTKPFSPNDLLSTVQRMLV